MRLATLTSTQLGPPPPCSGDSTHLKLPLLEFSYGPRTEQEHEQVLSNRVSIRAEKDVQHAYKCHLQKSPV